MRSTDIPIRSRASASTPLAGSPFKSGGSDPVSLAYLSNIYTGQKSWLGVVNKGRDPNQNNAAPNINVFRVDNSTGAPTGVTAGTMTLASGTSPSQLITATGAPAQRQFWAFLDQYRTAGSSTAGLYS